MFQPHLNNRIRTTRRPNAEGGISLAKRRTWHIDDPNAGGGAGGAGGSTPPDGAQNTDKFIPKSRFDEVNNELKALRDQIAADKTAADAAEQERLRQQGQYQTLAEQEKKRADELAPKAARAEALEKMITDSNTARINQVPEAKRSMIPVKYPPELLSSWLDENWSLLTVTPAPELDNGAGGGSGGNGGTVTLTADEKEIARKTGMTDAQYLAAKAKLPT